MSQWKLNTSNQGKFAEFKQLFAKYGKTLEATHFDLKEIDADPLQVIAHKASQLGEKVIVDDTSLEVEGAALGIHIRWLLDHLKELLGRKASWTAYLAYRQGDEILIFKGHVSGKIVEARGGAGFGFDPFFLPEGASLTLAEDKPDAFNARAMAVESMLKGDVFARHPLIEDWKGPWQH